ncbi:PTH11-like G-protein-coupled receptor [Trichoderma parareesei]|uniref:PTH11-like G-protein-coupled receptor n=1 Tax=Trichoderma parareesei TaxID=858221 RepID=A0A2H2ZHK7_TRIPA|nr:PTH11-like G-protein-coupled receptor [Trichoderma parareesei]
MINPGIDGPLLSRRDAIDDGDPNPRGESLARLSIIFVCLAGFFVVLRLLTRHFHTKAFGADDALIVVALALSVCMTVAYNGEAGNGFGLHSDQINQEHKILAFKYFFAAQILYKVATCLTKSSLGMLYLRIFPGHKFRIAVITVVGVTVAYTFAAVLLTVFACKPIEKAWRKTLPGVCVNSISICDIRLEYRDGHPDHRAAGQRDPTTPAAAGEEAVALRFVQPWCTTASDQTYYQAVSNSWTFVETNVGIVCACLPIVWVPITRQILRLFGVGREDTAATGKSGQTYSLGSHGLVSSARGRTSPRDAEGDSVEELMFHGIKMTRRFSAHVVREDQGQNEAPVSDRPWEHVPQPAPP